MRNRGFTPHLSKILKIGARDRQSQLESKQSLKGAGFTLIELLAVVAVIGILSGIVLITANNIRKRARDTKRIADLNQIAGAIELFYEQTGKYPQSPGHATWSGHWAYFSECLELGSNCGFTITGYNPVISKVPQDPSRTETNPFIEDKTYYPGYPTGCSGQSYRLAAYLETIDADTIANDLDGSFYNNNGGCTGWNKYCVGVGTCAGW